VAEGDTIHRLARRLGAALAGERIVAARAPSPRSPLHRGAERLQGLRLESAEARGKHLLLGFEDGLVLRSHLRMGGAWHLYRRGEPWRRAERRAWLVLTADGVEAVQFDGPELELLRRSQLASHPRLGRLGPDLLAPEFTVAAGVAALRRGDERRRLGDALLDQSLIAGIGNIYKSEGCHRAGIDPWRQVGGLGDEELAAVVAATAELMREGAAAGRLPKRVYRAAGRPCPRCRDTLIRSRGQGDDNRTTYWCPVCQR
jgi:endonuclease-8